MGVLCMVVVMVVTLCVVITVMMMAMVVIILHLQTAQAGAKGIAKRTIRDV